MTDAYAAFCRDMGLAHPISEDVWLEHKTATGCQTKNIHGRQGLLFAPTPTAVED